nr:immunoglobulin light chain junction region [Macaca mulatta]MOV75309.1 immunoglobulin light chain junction region [Macaca mulatta]MOV76828.1 immunoglobulin light chain junction region [Macaca mulatta]MOV76846.1 immunoglobulin light chain junction region [Macaca mulatta]MOV77213.1 immunoglobulin light chain junction region [Macaca mulatta]
CQQYSSLPYAF